jgi:hypothetical protein
MPHRDTPYNNFMSGCMTSPRYKKKFTADKQHIAVCLNMAEREGLEYEPVKKFADILEAGRIQKRFFSAGKRRDLAKSGAALPDGSFPIVNAEDLRNAVALWRKGKDPAKAKAHIKARASALGLSNKLPKGF